MLSYIERANLPHVARSSTSERSSSHRTLSRAASFLRAPIATVISSEVFGVKRPQTVGRVRFLGFALRGASGYARNDGVPVGFEKPPVAGRRLWPVSGHKTRHRQGRNGQGVLRSEQSSRSPSSGGAFLGIRPLLEHTLTRQKSLTDCGGVI
jgi:hypothetical protein